MLILILFRRMVTDNEVVLAAHIVGNGFIKLVSGGAYRAGDDDAVHGDNGGFAGSSANIHHHIACRCTYGQIGTKGGCKRLGDEMGDASTCLNGCLAPQRGFLPLLHPQER